MTDLTDEAVKALLGRFENPASRADANKAIETVVLNFPSFARALLDARTELAAAQQREAALSDPICVHVNMLRGTIAKPTLDQIVHLYGVDALCKALMPVIVREAEAAIIRKGGTL